MLTEGQQNPGKVQTQPLNELQYQLPYPDEGNVISIPASTLAVHSGEVNSIVVTGDGSTIYSGGEDGAVRQTDITPTKSSKSKPKTSAMIRTLFQGERQILALALSADEHLLAFARFSAIYIYDLRTSSVTVQLTKVDGRITSLAFDPRGNALAIGRSDGKAFVWNFGGVDAVDANNRQRLEEYVGGTSPVIRVQFHSSGRALFVAERTGSIDVWRILQTEREAGIRDDDAQLDQRLAGNKRTSTAIPSGRLEDLWISSTSDEFVASTSDGKLYRFKTRGLKFMGQGDVAKDPLFTVTGLGGGLLGVTGREPRLQLWCLAKDGSLSSVGRSPLFDGSLTKLVPSGDHTVLWGAQKTGNLVKFDIGWLKQSPDIIRKNQGC